MKHVTRNMLIGMFLVLPFLGSTKGNAEQEGKITRLRKLYQQCVFDALASQIKNGRGKINPSAETEMAFEACRTEEQAILADAYAAGMTTVQANQAMSGHKLSLKQSIGTFFANLKKNAPKATARETIPAPADIPPPRPGCSSYKRYDGATVYINCP